jgi:hypothetical protein
MMRHSGPQSRCGGWLVCGLLASVAMMGIALSVAALPATALASAAPMIERFSASHITQNDATVEAQVNPGGLETTYEVFMPEYPCRFSECIVLHLGLGGGSIPATATDQSISIDLASKHVSLEADEQYRVAIIAKNSAGTVEEHYSFGALPKNAAPPSIDSESASNITEHSATLEAQINPDGLETSYEIWLAEKVECQAGRECPLELDGEISESRVVHGQIAAGDSAQTVSADLAHLEEGSYAYSYWVVATNSAGKTESLHQAFTALPEGSVPSGDSASSAATLSATSGGGQSGTVSTSAGSGESLSAPSSALGVTATSLISPLGKSRVLTKTQKLSNALKACDKKPKKQRASCKKQAEKKYATTARRA